jgi:hypothetical protein
MIAGLSAMYSRVFPTGLNSRNPRSSAQEQFSVFQEPLRKPQPVLRDIGGSCFQARALADFGSHALKEAYGGRY